MMKNWQSANPSPRIPAKQPPNPADYGISPQDVLSNRKIFYHEPLGKSGAEIGGVSSTSSIHLDGHTWFPPGWELESLMRVLESAVPGVVDTPMSDANGIVIAAKRTAWLKRLPNGTFEIAPPGTADLINAGYLKSSMIKPTDPRAKRTVFPEMNQT